MLLSDRDIRAEVDAGRLVLEPWDADLVQPSSVDVRLDRFFRVFNNSQYTHIDPSEAAGRADRRWSSPRTRTRSCCIRASSCSARRSRS